MRTSLKRTIITSKPAGRKSNSEKSNKRRYDSIGFIEEFNYLTFFQFSRSQSEDLSDGIDDDTVDLSSVSTSIREKSKANRQIDVDEQTGKRSFRDESGRRRYLCSDSSCTNMLKRQTDSFCQRFDIDDSI